MELAYQPRGLRNPISFNFKFADTKLVVDIDPVARLSNFTIKSACFRPEKV